MEKVFFKKKIYDFVDSIGSISFAEFMSRMPESRGKYAMEIKDHNICLWTSCSPEFIDAMTELMAEKKIIAVPTTVLIYLVDGQSLNLPIARQKKKYKDLRWLPLVFYTDRNNPKAA